jgi:4-amino-4-deoxy-L-arabinose transferase-like glycosyltransferase
MLSCYAMLLFAYLGGLAVPLMDVDAAHHAAVALRIADTGEWTRLVSQGRDYTGQPPLLFWLSAASFTVFGVEAVAYRLPSLMFACLAVYSTFHLATLLHNQTTGRLATVIMGSAFAFLLVNNDVRMDAMLIGAIAFTTWQLIFSAAYRDGSELARRQHIMVAGAGLALGFATKGIFGVLPPLVALLLYLVYKLEWRRLFDPAWLLLPLSALIFSAPVLYAYYQQFGAERMQDVLWMQNIEPLLPRHFGSSENGDRLFYYHTFLWVFLPWSLLALWSFASSALRLTNDRYWPRACGDAVTTGVVVVSFIFFTCWDLHLLYCLNILLPFFAIQLARWLPARLARAATRKWLFRVQIVVFVVLVAGAVVLNGWAFPLRDWDWLTVLVALALPVAGFWVAPRWVGHAAQLVTVTVGMTAAFWMLLNLNFYPRLLDYQAGTVLGEAAVSLHIAPTDLRFLDGDENPPSFDVATRRITPTITLEDLEASSAPTVLFVTAEGRERIEERALPVEVLAYSPNYPVYRLKWRFLDPNTRSNELSVAYLLRVKPTPPEPGL